MTRERGGNLDVLRWFLALIAALLIGSAAQAEIPPRPEGPILDAADIIPAADEAALDAKLRAYNAETGRALLVVTVPSLEGRDIAEYGVELGQTWGVGGKSTDQGLILLVAPNERRMRFEVGYGLEQYLPDVLAGRIIRDVITPRFKAGDFPGGIAAGIDAAITQVYERRFRPEAKVEQAWLDRQQVKIDGALAVLEANPPAWTTGPDYGHLTVAVSLGYLDFRHEGKWRAKHPKMVAWLDKFAATVPSFEKTKPQ